MSIDPEYMSLAELAQYCSVGKKTLKKWINRGMPVFKVGRLIRVKKCEFDAWMKQFRIGAPDNLDTIWDQVMREV